MKRSLESLCVCAAALALSVLSGSSQGRAEDPLSVAPSQVSAALHVQQWGQILWGLVTTQTGTQTPSFGEPVFNPDGSVSQSFTTADGTEVTLTGYPDGSVLLHIVLPDGTTQTVSQSVPVFDGVSVTTTDWSVTSSDGLSVDYTSFVDDRGTIFDMSDDITELIGTAVLPEDVNQEFNVLTADGWTDVYSTQSDGSTFTLSVPLRAPEFMFPDLTQEAAGTYTGPGFSMDFVLAPTPVYPDRWAAILSDASGGVRGDFSFERDFSGFGQLYETRTWGDVLAGLLSWSQDGEVHVYLLSGQDRSMGPAGAALDYLEHRWQTLTALLAPAPGAGTSVVERRRNRTAPRQRADRRRPSRSLSVEPAASPESGAPNEGPRIRDAR
jgi:hypothetical protein